MKIDVFFFRFGFLFCFDTERKEKIFLMKRKKDEDSSIFFVSFDESRRRKKNSLINERNFYLFFFVIRSEERRTSLDFAFSLKLDRQRSSAFLEFVYCKIVQCRVKFVDLHQ